MNTPTQTTNATCNQQVISAVRCVLLFATVQNTSGASRVYWLADASSAPPTDGRAQNQQGILSPPIPAGQTWRVFPVDASVGTPFVNGCVLQSFALSGPAGLQNPVFTALSSADANLTAWSAPLQ